MASFELRWQIAAENEGKMIREFLREKEVSKSALTDIKFKNGFIRVNGKEETVRYFLKNGDFLLIGFPEEVPSDGMKAEDLPLDIIYEDDFIIVINKSAGMSTIPSREHPSGSLANALLAYYNKIGLKTTAHIVTRLDRDTSGLVLIAKHRHIHHLLSIQQKAGKVNREYEALAEGIIALDFGTINEPIARKHDSIIEREVSPIGQYACTHFEVIKRYKSYTHVKLKLETGRTHQIRVHLSYLGYPLMGDDLYGGHTDLLSHQALHCKKVSFFHPVFEKEMTFKAELPAYMKMLLKNEG